MTDTLDLTCSAEGHDCKLFVDYHEPVLDGDPPKMSNPWFTFEVEGGNISLTADNAAKLAAFLTAERK